MVIRPSLALGAPQTTFKISFPPIVTSQTFNLSALGCLSVFKTFAILNLPNSPEFSFIPSTSSPIFVSWLMISLYFTDVFIFSLSQGIVIIIYSILYNLLEHLMDQIQNDLAIYNLPQRKILDH